MSATARFFIRNNREHFRIYSTVVFDLHNDLLTSRLSLREKFKAVNAFSDYGRVILAVFTTHLRDPSRAIPRLTAPFRTRQLLAIEDLGYTVAGGLETVKTLAPLYVGLTWNFDNGLAGGTYGHDGLSALGRHTVSWLNNVGICVDLAHLNDRSFDAVLDSAVRPIDSHTGCRVRNGHPRNLTDRQMRVLANRGGIIGITAAKELGIESADMYIENIIHAVDTVGIDFVAIGSDMYGATMPAELTTYSGFAYIADSLSKHGYSKDAIDKLLYRNAARFFEC